jgi:enoyl-CoA hydratase/carnithine racemase
MDMFTPGYPSKIYADGKMLASKADGVGIITFNQPEKRNAMSVGMWTGMAEILSEFQEDSSVRSVIPSREPHLTRGP